MPKKAKITEGFIQHIESMEQLMMIYRNSAPEMKIDLYEGFLNDMEEMSKSSQKVAKGLKKLQNDTDGNHETDLEKLDKDTVDAAFKFCKILNKEEFIPYMIKGGLSVAEAFQIGKKLDEMFGFGMSNMYHEMERTYPDKLRAELSEPEKKQPEPEDIIGEMPDEPEDLSEEKQAAYRKIEESAAQLFSQSKKDRQTIDSWNNKKEFQNTEAVNKSFNALKSKISSIKDAFEENGSDTMLEFDLKGKTKELCDLLTNKSSKTPFNALDIKRTGIDIVPYLEFAETAAESLGLQNSLNKVRTLKERLAPKKKKIKEAPQKTEDIRIENPKKEEPKAGNIAAENVIKEEPKAAEKKEEKDYPGLSQADAAALEAALKKIRSACFKNYSRLNAKQKHKLDINFLGTVQSRLKYSYEQDPLKAKAASENFCQLIADDRLTGDMEKLGINTALLLDWQQKLSDAYGLNYVRKDREPEKVILEIQNEQPKAKKIPAEQPKEEKIPAEQPKEENIPAEQPKEEKIPAEQPKEEKIPAEQQEPKQEAVNQANDAADNQEVLLNDAPPELNLKDMERRLKSKSFGIIGSSFEHGELLTAFKAYKQSRNVIDNNEEESRQKLKELLTRAENYVVEKRGSKWKGDENWRPDSTAGKIRFEAALEIIQYARKKLGMSEFDKAAHDNIRLFKDSHKDAFYFKDFHTGEYNQYKNAEAELLRGGNPYNTEKLNKIYPKTNSIADNQIRIMQTLSEGKPENQKDFEDQRKCISVLMSAIIARHALGLKNKVTDSQITKKAQEIRDSKSFKGMINGMNNWEKLVKMSTKALQGKGSELVISYAKIHKMVLEQTRPSKRNEKNNPVRQHDPEKK
ncbi:MAG: hypothetical protein IKI58_05965 [Oscillospiraceae bacterium]|nr:hypothetical protein [Oscillospiraceae bacterium]